MTKSTGKMLIELLLNYKPDHFVIIDTGKSGHKCNFCQEVIERSTHWHDSDFHKNGCPLPEAMKWMERENEQD